MKNVNLYIKNYLSIAILCVFGGCFPSNNIEVTELNLSEKIQQCQINTAYPQLSGFFNEQFEQMVNERLFENTQILSEKLIDYAKNDTFSQYCATTYQVLNIPNDDDLLSIYQETVLSGSSNPKRNSMITNIDLKNEKIIGYKADDWGISLLDRDLLNQSIATYFEKQNRSNSSNQKYPLVYDEHDCEKLLFGIKDQQIVFTVYTDFDNACHFVPLINDTVPH